jgi:hypothetical protein
MSDHDGDPLAYLRSYDIAGMEPDDRRAHLRAIAQVMAHQDSAQVIGGVVQVLYQYDRAEISADQAMADLCGMLLPMDGDPDDEEMGL